MTQEIKTDVTTALVLYRGGFTTHPEAVVYLSTAPADDDRRQAAQELAGGSPYGVTWDGYSDLGRWRDINQYPSIKAVLNSMAARNNG